MDEYGCNSNSGSGQRVLGGSSTGLVFGPAKVPCGSGRAQGELLLFVLSQAAANALRPPARPQATAQMVLLLDRVHAAAEF